MFHYILIFPYVSFLAVNPKNWRKTFNKAQKFSEKITLHNLRHALVLRKYSPIWIFRRKWTFRPNQKLYQENLTIGILSFCKISIFILSWPRKVNRTWTLTVQKLLLSHQLRLFNSQAPDLPCTAVGHVFRLSRPRFEGYPKTVKKYPPWNLISVFLKKRLTVYAQ